MPDEQGERSLFLAPVAPVAAQEGREGDAEPPAGPAAPLVEVEAGRRRWLAVLVVLALLVAGAVANRRNAQQVEAPDLPEPVEEARSIPAPAIVAPAFQTIDRFSPPLPEPTGTTLALAASTQVVLVDVDSGTVRNVHVADLEASTSYPWGSQVLPVGDALVVRSQPPRAYLVPRADGGAVGPLEVGSGGGLYPSQDDGRLWVDERRGDPRLEEVDLAGNVSRSVPVLDGVTSIVWDGSGFIQSIGGEALATPVDGEPSRVAAGTAVAAADSLVALLRCDGGRGCRLSLLDRDVGTTRPVAPPRGSTAFLLDGGATFSPDGRWLLVSAGGPAGADGGGTAGSEGAGGVALVPSGLAIVDVASASVRALEPVGSDLEPAAGAFSPSGRWLFLASSTGTVSAEVAAIDLEAGRRYALTSLQVRSGFGLVLEALPSVPADLGAAGS